MPALELPERTVERLKASPSARHLPLDVYLESVAEADISAMTTAHLGPAGLASFVAGAEHAIGRALPKDLRALLFETDGVLGQSALPLVWMAERIAKDNRLFRTKPEFRDFSMPFDCLLFFGDAGNGDRFAFPIRRGESGNANVFVWNHENDTRACVAPSLGKFLEWFVARKIVV